MSDVPLFVWPVGPIINTEPVRYVVNKTDHDRVVDALREQNRVLREALQAWMVYYEGHSTAGNRDRAYFMTRAALTATSQPERRCQDCQSPYAQCQAWRAQGKIACCPDCRHDATSQEGQHG